MKPNAETANVEFIIKVLTARIAIEDTKKYAIKQLQAAIDGAKLTGDIDQTLVNRAMDADKSIEELTEFANNTIDLRKALIAALKDALN